MSPELIDDKNIKLLKGEILNGQGGRIKGPAKVTITTKFADHLEMFCDAASRYIYIEGCSIQDAYKQVTKTGRGDRN